MSAPGWRNIKIKVIQSNPPGSSISMCSNRGHWRNKSNQSDNRYACNTVHDDRNLHNKDRLERNRKPLGNRILNNIQRKKNSRSNIRRPHSKNRRDSADHSGKGCLALVEGRVC